MEILWVMKSLVSQQDSITWILENDRIENQELVNGGGKSNLWVYDNFYDMCNKVSVLSHLKKAISVLLY